MLNVIFRTVIIYAVLIIIMKVMGKRQLGELDVGELVITILLSEIASQPITSPQSNVWHAIVPITLLALLEILTSATILRVPFIKRVLSSKPSVIISRGKIDLAAMKRVRISIEDLISQIRLNGIYDIKEVDYAILEENGKMSIIPKSRFRQPDKSELGMSDNDSGMMHIVISDGIINKKGLQILNKQRDWLDKTLKKYNCTAHEVLCMTCNDANDVYIIKRDGSSPSPEK